jgi:pimeloyl-ACP methyl ester carboxylesterase
MNIVDRGSGEPVVLIPGVQGRWEWMAPGVDALAKRCRVITFSLADEPTCGARFDASRGFECYVQQVIDAMDAAGVASATVCGVSYAGLIAAAVAARHPERVSSLVLVSAIPPSWRPDERVKLLIGHPRLLSPLFCLGALRLYPEIASARGGLFAALWFMVVNVGRILRHMFSPTLMASRVLTIAGLDLEPEVSRLEQPALVITGDEADRVVPAHLTRQYLQLLPKARSATIPRTGHLGLVTRPEVFADLVTGFMGQTVRAHEGPRPQASGPSAPASGHNRVRTQSIRAFPQSRLGCERTGA